MAAVQAGSARATSWSRRRSIEEVLQRCFSTCCDRTKKTPTTERKFLQFLYWPIGWCKPYAGLNAIQSYTAFRSGYSEPAPVQQQHSSQPHRLRRSVLSFREGVGRILRQTPCRRCKHPRSSLSAARIMALSNSTNRHMLSSEGPRTWSLYRARHTSSQNPARSNRL